MTYLLAHGVPEQIQALAATAPIIAGLVAGAAHVLMGPDHIAALHRWRRQR